MYFCLAYIGLLILPVKSIVQTGINSQTTKILNQYILKPQTVLV